MTLYNVNLNGDAMIFVGHPALAMPMAMIQAMLALSKSSEKLRAIAYLWVEPL
jgi:hypothetical protein